MFNLFQKISLEDWNKVITAAQQSDPFKLKMLLNKHNITDVDKKNFKDRTLLIFAALCEADREGYFKEHRDFNRLLEQSKRFKATVELLLERGAFINAQDNEGNTVLDIMNSAKLEDNAESKKAFLKNMDFLIEKGAKVGAEIRLLEQIRSLAQKSPSPSNP
ncbi:MAG: hypothetical protein KAS59_00455 [Alphaproteobacteria bacterium]|nr:hypothetical protein [Alphaproteobacteria bacterium]